MKSLRKKTSQAIFSSFCFVFNQLILNTSDGLSQFSGCFLICPHKVCCVMQLGGSSRCLVCLEHIYWLSLLFLALPCVKSLKFNSTLLILKVKKTKIPQEDIVL